MNIDVQDFLSLVEESNKLIFVDTEDTGLKGDYNSVLVVSCLPFKDKQPVSFKVTQPGHDIKVVRDAKEFMESALCWVTYYGRGFDLKMLNTRLIRWGYHPVESRHHIDLYFALKYHLLTARKSQAHLLRFLDCEQQKMDMSPEEWNLVLADPTKNLPKMVKRCESDTMGLRDLYKKTRHLLRDAKR